MFKHKNLFSKKTILNLQNINSLLPKIEQKKNSAIICLHCNYINQHKYSFCTNCGYPLHDEQLIDTYNKRVQQRTNLLFKAEMSVLVARISLYVMASFLSISILFIFGESSGRYLLVSFAIVLSALFFTLAFWSRKNPFTALLTTFIVLIVFSAINIFSGLTQSYITITSLTGMLLCLVLLFIILRGIQAAYRINLIKQELEF